MNSIKLKIILAFSVMVSIFALLAISVFVVNFNLTNRYKEINNNIIYEQSLRDNVWSLIEASYIGFNTGDYSSYYQKLEEVKNIELSLDKILEASNTNKETKLAYRSVKNSLSSIFDSIENTKLDLKQKGEITGISESFQELTFKFEFVRQNVTNLLILETKNIAETTKEINKIQGYLKYFVGISIPLILIISILFIIIFSSRISKPIVRLSQLSEKISDGDLNSKVDDDLVLEKDEIGLLSKSFNKMIRRLRDKIEAFNLSNKELDLKVKELSDTNSNFESSQKAVLNLLEDISKEKENSERLAGDLEKFKLAVDNVSDHVVITDPDGIVIYGNKAIEKITGYKAEEAIGKKAGVLWKKPMPMEFYKNLWDTIKNKKETFIGEVTNIRKNGKEYQALVNISPILDKENNIMFFVGLERDVTKEREIDKAKTEFVSLASHQLRTPLSTINWYTEMLLSGDAGEISENQKKYLEEIYAGNQRMVELVNSLLNVSRLELGTFIIEPELSDVVELGDSIIKEMTPLSLGRKQNLLFIHEEGIPKIMIDQKLLRMVLQNFLSNSVKYTEDGGNIKLEMKKIKEGEVLKEVKVKEDSLLISVADNGYGITKNQQDKIFSKLFRADNIKEKSTEGTGLGLYIIKTIIDNSGGQVWFESEENKGTTFYVAIPMSGMKKKEGSKALS